MKVDGIRIRSDGYGNTVETPTHTCAHCNLVYAKPQPGADSGFCMLCFTPVCLGCAALDRCEPFEKKLLRAEARGKLLRSVEG